MVGPDGVVVAWVENRGDGFFEASVAPGSYALLAGVEVYNASYWLPVWGLSGTASGITGERLWQAFAEQEMVVALAAEELAGAE